jgi:hypothetical protein
MITWNLRPPEEQRLLNPSFCSLILWHSARAHSEVDTTGLGIAFEECFLVLPMVLHREIRESLPKKGSTSLPVWLGQNPLASATISSRASSLVPFTKEALLFGGAYGALQFNQTIVRANPDWKKRMTAALNEASDEVRICAKRAEFVGRWFAKTGSTETIFSLLGLQP